MPTSLFVWANLLYVQITAQNTPKEDLYTPKNRTELIRKADLISKTLLKIKGLLATFGVTEPQSLTIGKIESCLNKEMLGKKINSKIEPNWVNETNRVEINLPKPKTGISSLQTKINNIDRPAELSYSGAGPRLHKFHKVRTNIDMATHSSAKMRDDANFGTKSNKKSPLEKCPSDIIDYGESLETINS